MKRFAHLLSSYRCIVCGGKEKTLPLCHFCQQFLPILPQNCQQCAQILTSSEHGNIYCEACIPKPLHAIRSFARFPYEFPVSEWIRRLKFSKELIYADLLGKLLINQLSKWYENQTLPQCIIPIPLHYKRLKTRGYNQALEIARPISKFFKIPIEISGVSRQKPTMPQTLLQAHERELNMLDAFRIDKDFTGVHVALIDDVMTTGFTLAALADGLLQAGAAKVDSWCCARAKIDRSMVAQNPNNR